MPEFDGREAGGLLALGQQGEVEFAGAQAGQEFDRGQAIDCDLDGGMGVGEAFQHRGQIAQGVVVGRAEADGALDLGGAEGLPDRVVQREQFAGAVEQHAAMRGEDDVAAAAALEQALTEGGFQALDLNRDGRLGAAASAGR